MYSNAYSNRHSHSNASVEANAGPSESEGVSVVISSQIRVDEVPSGTALVHVRLLLPQALCFGPAC